MAHSLESRRLMSQNRLATAHRIADAYDELGLPVSKRCSNPDCEMGRTPQPTEAFYVKRRKWKDGRVTEYLSGQCRRCAARIKRAHRERMKRENPEAFRQARKRWREKHKNKDPDDHREYQRIWAEGKRRREGVEPRTFGYRKALDEGEDPRLEVTDAFRAYLNNLPPGLTISRLEEILEMASKMIHAYATGERNTIRLSIADRILHYVDNGYNLQDFWDV